MEKHTAIPIRIRRAVFSRQSVWKIDLTKAILEILLMNQPDFIQMMTQ